MEARIVKGKDLSDFVRQIADGRRIVGPLADRTGIRYEETEDPGSLHLAAGRGTISSKGFLFPQAETLFPFSAEGVGGPTETAPETVLFGVRPCDARAFTLLDRVFHGNEIDDPYYVERRAKTAVVSLACSAPEPACFCTSVEGGPADPTGADLLMIDLDDRLLAKAVTKQGEELLRKAEELTDAATEADLAAAARQAENAETQMEDVDVPTDLDRLTAAFDGPIWDEIAASCLGCGVCTYACPTCHCFDITDEARRGRGHRVRSWDSCAFTQFTLHSSGHNPRETRGARLRQRILHKFLYCPENYDEIFCVGCGRCISGCPTGIDLRSILERLTAAVAAGGA